MSPVAGIAAISKPAGVTSFAALSPIKRSLGLARVGHAGTLDRFATGLLVVLVGPYSRLCPDFSSLDKTYVASVLFGEETDTLDPEGEVVSRAPVPTRETVEKVLPGFRGRIMQAPPGYSALHVGGERAYARALRGEAVEMKARPVEIFELELLDFDGATARLFVRCSSGTYVRSLARDIALAAGSRARLETLERRSIGPISLEGAVAPMDFDAARDLSLLDPMMALALGLRPRMIAASAEKRFRNGGVLFPVDLSAPVLAAGSPGAPPRETQGSAVFLSDGTFLGVIEEGDEDIHYRFVMPESR